MPTRLVVALGRNLDDRACPFRRSTSSVDVKERENVGIRVLGILDDFFENAVRDGLHVDLRIQPQAESTQEDRREDLALAETRVKQVLLVVFKLDPRAAVRNDLREIFIAVALEENAGRAMKLRNDDALGSVDDERTVVGHQRNLAEEDFFFLDVADGRDVRVSVLVVDRQADLDLERNAVRHAAFLALLLIVLVLQTDRLAAVVAEIRANGVERAAVVTKHLGRVERIDLDLGAAVLTVCPQVFEALEVSALALPVADLVLDKFERRCLAKIRNRKDRLKYRLQPDVVALLRDQVHLQKAVVRLALYLDQIWDLRGRVDL